MRKNWFIPPGLPILSDFALKRTETIYKDLCWEIESSAVAGVDDLRAQLVEALMEIEKELCTRGLEEHCTQPHQLCQENLDSEHAEYEFRCD